MTEKQAAVTDVVFHFHNGMPDFDEAGAALVCNELANTCERLGVEKARRAVDAVNSPHRFEFLRAIDALTPKGKL
ncbi:hypothetical protein LCGC14_1411240 [marine sediment metagenome]|uniref:Uncharacterized protein n=1 Tax=marine sediment metagenome TaxID=412755 RepID=A0A0F9KF90_9ZZZZ